MKLSVATLSAIPLGSLWLLVSYSSGGEAFSIPVLPSSPLSSSSSSSQPIIVTMNKIHPAFLMGHSYSMTSIRAVSGDLSDGHDFEQDDDDEELKDECVVSSKETTPQQQQEQQPDRDLIQEILSGPPEAPWAVVNDFEMLLNQCCLQSFLFLVKSMRDIQTVLWMEDFVQPTIHLRSSSSNNNNNNKHTEHTASAALMSGKSDKIKLLSYHGLGALNTTRFPTWDSLFAKLLEQPKEYFIVESGFRHIPDYEMEINPASLCSRIISVREQIAREWVKDLSVIAHMGNHTLTSYWDGIQQQRNSTTITGNTKKKKNMITPEERVVAASNMLFLELGCQDSADYAPSPLRKGNFDLLLLLATQESIHRILNSPTATDNSTRQYLQNFYLQRLESHFCNTHRYNLADHFLKELLAEPPSVVRQVNNNDDNNNNNATTTTASLIDPTRLAELLLEQREQVAHEWKDLAAQVPDSHIEIKRLQFNLLMSTYTSSTGTTTTTDSSNNNNDQETTTKEQPDKNKKTPVPVGATATDDNVPEDKKQQEPSVNKKKKKKMNQARKKQRKAVIIPQNKTYSVGEVEDFQ